MRYMLLTTIMFAVWAMPPAATSQEKSKTASLQEQARKVIDVQALLETGRQEKALPAGVVVRLTADLFKSGPADARERAAAEAQGVDFDKKLKEAWEFTSGKVHRVIVEPPKRKGGDFVYRREKTLAFDTKNICHELLDGKILAIDAGEGNGKAVAFLGTEFDLGDRSIEVLVDGETVLWIGESCLFGGYAETDAKAFAKLYDQLASQARAAFSAKPALSVPRDK